MTVRSPIARRTASPASLWLVVALLFGALWPDWAMALRPSGLPFVDRLCITVLSSGDAAELSDSADDGAVGAMPRCSACLHAALAGAPTVEPDDLPRPVAVSLLAVRGTEQPRPDLGPIRHAARPRGPPRAG
ncbi:MAG: hypothetical protein RLZZ524_3200 [Pseudomonadota bacterium]|jgi:hypothetical protein